MRSADLERLDFNTLKEKIKEFCKSSATHAFVDSITPKTDRDEVIQELSLSKDFFRIAEHVSLYPFEDISQSLKKSTIKDAYLSVDELREVQKVLKLIKELRKTLGSFSNTLTNLQRLTRKLYQFAHIENLIESSIDMRGFVKDYASVELAEIRNKRKKVEREVQSRLEAIISRPDAHTFLSDRLITYRNGRYMLPVKTSEARKLVGIVHGTSSSGFTTYLEPQSVVDLNNKLMELKSEEEEEVKRVLRRITSYIGEHADKILQAFETLLKVDYLKALYQLSTLISARFPKLGDTVKLKGVRHPILAMIKQDTVPITIDFHDKKGVLLTGPNTGGKTVALKTLGLCILMFQSGMPIPAHEDSIMPVFSGVFVDVGDEQSMEQNLSTFSSHMTNMAEFLDKVDANSMVLLDELGAGTDPTEGSALGIGILEYLKERSAWVFANTHHTPIKLYAVNSNYYMTASVAFDRDTLKPLYEIVYGSVGESMAFEVAKRCGIPEEVLRVALAQLPGEASEYAQARESLNAYIREYQEKLKQVENLRQELEKLKAQEELKFAELERQKEQAIKSALNSAQEYLENLIREAESMITSAKERQRLREFVKEKRREIQKGLEEESIGVGDWVEFMGSKGRVVEIREDRANLIVGGMRVWARLSDLKRTDKPPQDEGTVEIELRRAGPSEINLTGLGVDEALHRLEMFLEEAHRLGVKSVKVIHGLGQLKKVVQDYLSKCDYVIFHREAYPKEGGAGASVVYLKRD